MADDSPDSLLCLDRDSLKNQSDVAVDGVSESSETKKGRFGGDSGGLVGDSSKEKVDVVGDGGIEKNKGKDKWGDETGEKYEEIGGNSEIEKNKGKDKWGDEIGEKVDVVGNGGIKNYRAKVDVKGKNRWGDEIRERDGEIVVNGEIKAFKAKDEWGDEIGEKVDVVVSRGIENCKEKNECGDEIREKKDGEIVFSGGIEAYKGKNEWGDENREKVEEVAVNGGIETYKAKDEWGDEIGEEKEIVVNGRTEAYNARNEWGDEIGEKVEEIAVNGRIKVKDEWEDDIVEKNEEIVGNGGIGAYKGRDEWGDEIGEKNEGNKGVWEAKVEEKFGVEYSGWVSSLAAGHNEAAVYPSRPGKTDCAYYMRTGNCAYGVNCRFNHPTGTPTNDQVKRRDLSEVAEIVEEKGAEDFSGRVGHIECKYYLTPGGCKYGKSCKYEHVQEKLEEKPVNLNFLGLPIRPGVKDCVYYMRNGACKYSSNCCFNHPDPTAMAGQNSFPAHLDGGSLSQSSPMMTSSRSTAEKHYTATEQYTPMVSTYPTSSSEAMPKPAVSMSNALPSYIPRMLFPPRASNLSSGLNEYQAPANMHFPTVKKTERTPYITSDRTMSIADCVLSQQVQMDFPERPGQPECPFFMKTGNCKFRSQCKFHHPRSRLSKESVGPHGLPLRPDQPTCCSYSRFGICKYGPDCKFDHPADPNSSTTGAARSYREIVNARAL